MSSPPTPKRITRLTYAFLATFVLFSSNCLASLTFPLPVSSAVCPSFARYRYLHRAALGQRTSIPGQHRRPLHGTAASAADGGTSTRIGHHHARVQQIQDPKARGDGALLRRRRGLASSSSYTSVYTASASTSSLTTSTATKPAPMQPRPGTRWVVTADPDGLADRLVNAVSAFYFALLTERVLCIRPAHDAQPGLETAFATPNIDWTCGGSGSGTAASTGAIGPPLTGPDVAFWNPTEDDAWMDPAFEVYHTFVRSDLRSVGPSNATTILLRMHRGLSVALFNNPHHRRQLEALGLRPDTAFGCAVAFLFGLNAEARTLAEADPSLHEVMVDESAIKIGIQIRLGDDNILAQIEKRGETPLDDRSRTVVLGILDCADALAGSIQELSGPRWPHEEGPRPAVPAGAPSAPPPAPPPPVAGPPLRLYFYLMTDTLAVRRLAAERFGPRLLVLSSVAVQFYQNVTAAGLRSTALEHWYFSRCHHHVITGHSGMGRTAAFASLRPGPSLFSMELGDGTRTAGRGCAAWEADRPMDVYNTWSGV